MSSFSWLELPRFDPIRKNGIATVQPATVAGGVAAAADAKAKAAFNAGGAAYLARGR